MPVAAEKIRLSETDLALNSRITSIDIPFDRDSITREKNHSFLDHEETSITGK